MRLAAPVVVPALLAVAVEVALPDTPGQTGGCNPAIDIPLAELDLVIDADPDRLFANGFSRSGAG